MFWYLKLCFDKHIINWSRESHVSVEKIASTSDNDVSKGVENNDVTEKPDEVIEKDKSASQRKVVTSSDNGIMISEVKLSKLYHQNFKLNFQKNDFSG